MASNHNPGNFANALTEKLKASPARDKILIRVNSATLPPWAAKPPVVASSLAKNGLGKPATRAECHREGASSLE
ncbi:hypothetical protein AnigIFM56816_000827 [Aspergillus niger]|nr:hypothetical protein AnigIFM56816_000827 [Aspergillus niger]